MGTIRVISFHFDLAGCQMRRAVRNADPMSPGIDRPAPADYPLAFLMSSPRRCTRPGRPVVRRKAIDMNVRLQPAGVTSINETPTAGHQPSQSDLDRARSARETPRNLPSKRNVDGGRLRQYFFRYL
jgi:hypothetical protein